MPYWYIIYTMEFEFDPKKSESNKKKHDIDFEQLKKAHALYLEKNLGQRDDSVAMQYLIKNWQFNHKKPALVREK